MTRPPRSRPPRVRGPFVLGLVGALATSAVAPAVAGLAGPLRLLGPGVSLTAQVPSDSARARILERLQILARPPGLDSTLLVSDSVLRAREQAGVGAARPGASAAGSDSVYARLLGLPGYSVTRYEAGSADFGDRTLSLRAGAGRRPQVTRDGIEIAADSAIHYDERRGRIRSEGGGEMVRDGEQPLTSQVMIFDLGEQRGTALGARTTYTEGANWIVTGDLTSVTQGTVWGDHPRFTSCDLEIPHYHFETGEIKIVAGKVLVARPVTLYFGDVPVVWLPFLAQGLGTGRSSGLLTPRFSVNDVVRTSRGFSRRISNVGFYWAMSDYSDMTMALDWFSGRFISVQGGLRYRWARQFLRGALNYRQYWESDGGRQLSFDTNHQWDISERTNLNVRGSFASSGDFVRQHSFDPRETLQSIDSEGGIAHRFDWGRIDAGAFRKQFLSNDRVETTLPSVTLSLNPITFFSAPSARARFYNNITWSGSGRYKRDLRDLPDQVDVFQLRQADQVTTNGNVSSSFSIGGFSLSQGATYRESVARDVPDSIFVTDSLAPVPTTVADVGQAQVDWNASLDYQQPLFGSVTLTPRVSLTGSLLRSDTIEDARNSFVAGPSRMTVGAALKMDLYGFFPGFGGFERVRHKVSPSFTWDYAPEVSPTELQQRVFAGSGAIRRQNSVNIQLNQTFEAKRSLDEPDAAAAGTPADAAGGETLRVPVDSAGPRRLEQAEIVTLLGIATSAVRYDFVVADSTGRFVDGFQSTRLSNQVTSDFLRGLSMSVTHDLFEGGPGLGGGADGGSRRFSPHLAELNLGFSLSANSALFRWMGLGTADAGTATRADSLDAEPDPLDDALDAGEAAIVPRAGDPFRSAASAGSRRRSGPWTANLTYSLQRPRDESLERNQMITANLRFNPTSRWGVSWRTSYDVDQTQFLDHVIRLSRDLHRWEANFDFRQTVTGNWTFRFEVALTDNRDLKFDYEQRNVDAGLPRTGFPGR